MSVSTSVASVELTGADEAVRRVIPDEAVGAVVDVFVELRRTGQPYSDMEVAERILEAAAPYIAAEAWDQGFDRGFYDPLAGRDRDASESAAFNPYSRPS